MTNTGPWNYILVWSDEVGNRDLIKNFIDSREEVITWHLCMSNAIFIRSQFTASGLQEMFREFTKDRGRFIVVDLNTDRSGWLPRKAWEFMKS